MVTEEFTMCKKSDTLIHLIKNKFRPVCSLELIIKLVRENIMVLSDNRSYCHCYGILKSI